MIFNFMIPVALLILLTTIFGTMSLRAVTSHQRQVIVESIENILDKCHHIDATVNCNWNGDYLPTLKCCDELQKRSDELQKVDRELISGFFVQISESTQKHLLYLCAWIADNISFFY